MTSALSTLEAVGIFAGIPLGVFALIAIGVSAPAWAREGRYRPGLAWDAGPVWLGGPDDAEGTAAPGDAPAISGPSAKVGGASAAW